MKYLLSGFILAFAAFSALLFATPVFAGDYGLSETAGAAQLITSRTPQAIAGQIIGAGLSLVGIIFFILMIYAGIRWMVSRGNEEQSKKALQTIIAAVIGLIIVLASYAITQFVFSSISGTSVAAGQQGSQNNNGGSGAGGEVVCGDAPYLGFSCVDVGEDSAGCASISFGLNDTPEQITGACDADYENCLSGVCGGPTIVCCRA